MKMDQQTYRDIGFRLPFSIVNPFTRGGNRGNVFTEHADHNSQILFLEKWLAAKGFKITSEEMPAWRRAHMSDLTSTFDFSNVRNISIFLVTLLTVNCKARTLRFQTSGRLLTHLQTLQLSGLVPRFVKRGTVTLSQPFRTGSKMLLRHL